jgi:hypothetical protein
VKIELLWDLKVIYEMYDIAITNTWLYKQSVEVLLSDDVIQEPCIGVFHGSWSDPAECFSS